MKRTCALLLLMLMVVSGISGAAASEPVLPIGDGENDRLVIAVIDNYYAAASYADPIPVLDYMEEITGVDIEWDVVVPSQYDEVMRIRLSAGVDLPDIIQIPGSGSNISECYDLGRQGLTIPLDDLIAEHAPNISKLFFEDIPQLGKQMTAPDGKIYSIAANFYGGNMVDRKGMMIRTDWLDALGLEVPTTPDEWYSVLKAFKEEDPNGNGLADEIPLTSIGGLGEYGYLATAFGLAAPATKFIVSDGVVVNQYDEPGFKDFLAFLNRLYVDGLLDPQYKTGDEAKLDAMVSKDIIGACAHFVTKRDLWTGTARLADNPNSANAEYRMILSPMDDEGNLRYIGRNLTGACYGITRDCEDPVLAIKWLDYVYASAEGRDTMLYGIEGLTYTLDENGGKVWTDYIANNPDGLNVLTALRSVGAFPGAFTNRTEEFYRLMVGEGASEDAAKIAPYTIDPFPQIMAPDDELDRIASLKADIDTYQSEMIEKFIMNQISLDEFDKFRSTAKAMGDDELREIYQTQYDRFIGN